MGKRRIVLFLILLQIIVFPLGAFVHKGLKIPDGFMDSSDEIVLFDEKVVLDKNMQNASDLCWDRENNRLVAIVNSPPEIHCLTPEGAAIQKIELTGFDDTEAITYITKDLFAIVNERKMDIVLARITINTKMINAGHCHKIQIEPEIEENKGIEGIAFDRESGSFFAVKEKDPKKIYRIRVKNWSGIIDKNIPPEYEVEPAWGLHHYEYMLKDFSGVHFDVERKQLLILSDESKAFVRLGLDGRSITLHDIEDIANMKIPQPEGIVISPERRLYIVSEPNLLYIFHQAG